MIRQPLTHPRNRRQLSNAQLPNPSFLTPLTRASTTSVLTITTNAPFTLGDTTTMIVQDSASVILTLISRAATSPTTLVLTFSATIDKTKLCQIRPNDPIARSMSGGYLLPGSYTIA